MDGLLLIRKPRGITSFSALGPVKRTLGIRKTGHAGTLDKFAEGLLIVLTGGMTKFVPYCMDLDKEYEALIEFGKETDTLDPEGKIIRTGSIPAEELVREKLRSFTGILEQRPPEYSAVHTEGVRAYQLARAGKPVELKARRIHVHSFEILDYTPPYLKARIRCSKGTYIRSLARDLGEACGSCGYVKELVRTRIGPFHIGEAVELQGLSASVLIPPLDLIRKMDRIGVLHLSDAWIGSIRNGQPLADTMFEAAGDGDGSYAVFSGAEQFLALVERTNGRYSYKFAADSSRR